jgi:hypothetical protein
MTYENFNRIISKLQEDTTVVLHLDSCVVDGMGTENYTIYRNTYFQFENGKLFRSVSHIYPEECKKISKNKIPLDSQIISLIEYKYGKKRYKNGTKNSKYFWLKGNKRIDFFDTLNKYVVVISDMSIEREILIGIENAKRETQIKEVDEESKIFSILKEKAKNDWPDDYITQEFWLNKQKEDYWYMKLLPDNNIKRRAQRDWPFDFTTQKYWYDKQMEAKERLKQ